MRIRYAMQKLKHCSVTVTEIIFSFICLSLFIVQRLLTQKKPVADRVVPCGSVILLRSPLMAWCRRVCRKTWGPCRVCCHSCTGLEASPTPPGPSDTENCTRCPSHLRYNKSAPFVATSVGMLGLVPAVLVKLEPRALARP